MEDLGRAFRRVHAQLFCELCVDHNTRLIALNDSIDTRDGNWQVLAGIATMRHELYNKDTSNRIRRTLRNRFSQGGVISFLIFGYEKPEGKKNDSDIRVIPDAREIYDEIFTRLERGATYAEIADSLNDRGIKPGKYAKSQRWTGELLRSAVHNPILMGTRVHNNQESYRSNKTGRKKKRLASPEQRLERHCPHLVIIERERWIRVTNMLRLRTEKHRIGALKSFQNSLPARPTKRTTWPGRHAICGVCGREMYWNASGDKTKLICSGAIKYLCWNVLGCPGRILGERLVKKLHEEIEKLPEYDVSLVSSIREKHLAFNAEIGKKLKGIDCRIAEIFIQINRVTDAISQIGINESLTAKLQKLESEKCSLQLERDGLNRLPEIVPELPSLQELKSRARNALSKLNFEDPEFGLLTPEQKWVLRNFGVWVRR